MIFLRCFSLHRSTDLKKYISMHAYTFLVNIKLLLLDVHNIFFVAVISG